MNMIVIIEGNKTDEHQEDFRPYFHNGERLIVPPKQPLPLAIQPTTCDYESQIAAGFLDGNGDPIMPSLYEGQRRLAKRVGVEMWRVSKYASHA